MNRKEFLEKLGLGAAFVLTSTCLGGCRRDETFKPTGPIDFTLDLENPEYSALNADGGYVIFEGVVVARAINGDYVAATQTCSHEGLNQIIYQSNEWYCTAHGARFELNGNGLNGNASNGLTIYNTNLIGNMLQIFS